MSTPSFAELFEDPGPFASAYVEVSRDLADGDRIAELQARDAANDLVAQGAPEAIADAVRERLATSHHRPAPVSRCVVASERGVLLDELTQVHLAQPITLWDVLPDVAEWYGDAARAMPFVLAVVDHEGGDVCTYDSGAIAPHDKASVGGATGPEHKVKGGAWSQLNFQRSTETTWGRNAEEVVAEVRRQTVGEGPSLVLIGGEVQARNQVAEGLQAAGISSVQLQTGSRHDDGSDPELHAEIAQALRGEAVSSILRDVQQLRDRLGQEAAAIGINDVASALVRGQVERLLIDPGAAAEYHLDLADHPGLALGAVQPNGPIRADLALVAAAALTDAEVVVTHAGTLGDAPVAALLRWQQESRGDR